MYVFVARLTMPAMRSAGPTRYPTRMVEAQHRRERIAGETDRDVRVVLEDRELVLAGEGEERVALGAAQRVAGGVLEVGDDVGELGLDARIDQVGDAVDVDAVGLELDHADVGEALAQAEERPVVGRALDDDRVARLDELVEQEGVGLHGAVGDDDVRRLDAVLLGDPLPERHVADRGAVRGRAAGVVDEGAHGGVLESIDVDDVQRRRPAGERDRVGGHGAKGRRRRPRASLSG